MRGWLGQPWVAVFCASCWSFTLAWHSKLGVQVVVEDYVHGKGAKTTLLLLSTFVHVRGRGRRASSRPAHRWPLILT